MSRDEQMKTPEQQARESDRLCLCCYMAPARDLKSVCKGCEEALLGQSRPYGTTKERWEGAAAYASSVPTQDGNYSIGQIQDATVAGHAAGKQEAEQELARLRMVQEWATAAQKYLDNANQQLIVENIQDAGTILRQLLIAYDRIMEAKPEPKMYTDAFGQPLIGRAKP